MHKLGFISLISIVIGSQLGSGAFVLPSVLAPFKTIGLFGWCISVTGAIALALVFSELASHFPQTGGPHIYVEKAFGRKMAFFTAWIYWIISWASSSILIITSANYLTAIVGNISAINILLLECALLFVIFLINIAGVQISGIISTILTILKILPLFVLPLLFLFKFNISNFESSATMNPILAISKTTLLTFWGFIGIECATAPASTVINPARNIPKAIIYGTLCVACIYVLNTISVIGITGFNNLLNTQAPYVLAISHIFPKYGEVVISFVSIIVCVGTLNAWTLTSGQIAYGAVQSNLFPKFLGKENKVGAPIGALLISTIGTLPFLIMDKLNIWTNVLEKLLDVMVSIFVVVYLTCCFAYLKFIPKWYSHKNKKSKYILSYFSIIFCLFILHQDSLLTCCVLLLFLMFGLPLFIKNFRNF